MRLTKIYKFLLLTLTATLMSAQKINAQTVSSDSASSIAAIHSSIPASQNNNPATALIRIHQNLEATSSDQQREPSMETTAQPTTTDIITIKVIYTDDSTKSTLPKTGIIKFQLYPDSNLQAIRDNFKALTDQKLFDGILFHRVINNFMIQTGDPESKTAPAGTSLGSGNVEAPGVAPMEFVHAQLFEPTPRFHKRGAVAIARTGDANNPQREGSSSQFYIVTDSTKWTPQQLIQLGNRRRTNYIQTLKQLLAGSNNEGFGQQAAIAMYERFYPAGELSPQVIEGYATQGGAAYLDEDYTIIGEIIEGMDIVTDIQNLKTDAAARPLGYARIISATMTQSETTSQTDKN